MGTTLLIIDPQHDFIDHDLLIAPALPVPGSTDDMNNLIDLIDFHGDQINRILIPLDQHPPNHIAHAVMWIDQNGQHPDPFTTILASDVEAGRWRASIVANQEIQARYLREAE